MIKWNHRIYWWRLKILLHRYSIRLPDIGRFPCLLCWVDICLISESSFKRINSQFPTNIRIVCFGRHREVSSILIIILPIVINQNGSISGTSTVTADCRIRCWTLIMLLLSLLLALSKPKPLPLSVTTLAPRPVLMKAMPRSSTPPLSSQWLPVLPPRRSARH